MSFEVTVIYWRDIPAQVVAKTSGGKRDEARSSLELSSRFQTAIDRAAMHAGLIGTDEYLTEWRRETRHVAGEDADQAVAQVAADIENDFPNGRLQDIAKNGGYNKEKT